MDFPIDETVEEEYESLIKMDFSVDETVKEEHESLTCPFSEDELSDFHSGTGSSKHERQRKRQRSSSSDCESNIETEVPKELEASSTRHLHLDSDDSDVELTNTEKKVKKKIRRALRKKKGKPPKISQSNLMALLEKLKSTPKLSKQRLNQLDCVQRLHSSKNPMWTCPSVVLKAVKDCILNRKWNNLTHLLLIMIHFPTNKYKPLIKHLCLIIDRMHPVVQENDMTGQFRLVHQAARKTSITKIEPQT